MFDDRVQGHMIEHGCYDCGSGRSRCKHCDILEPTPTHWTQGRISCDRDIGRCMEMCLNEVVHTAVKDYRIARRSLAKRYSYQAVIVMKEVQEFLLSDRLVNFTKADGKYILERLKGEKI